MHTNPQFFENFSLLVVPAFGIIGYIIQRCFVFQLNASMKSPHQAEWAFTGISIILNTIVPSNCSTDKRELKYREHRAQKYSRLIFQLRHDHSLLTTNTGTSISIVYSHVVSNRYAEFSARLSMLRINSRVDSLPTIVAGCKDRSLKIRFFGEKSSNRYEF